jgi:hypothetical protein
VLTVAFRWRSPFATARSSGSGTSRGRLSGEVLADGADPRPDPPAVLGLLGDGDPRVQLHERVHFLDRDQVIAAEVPDRLPPALAEASGIRLMAEILDRLHPHTRLYRLYYAVGIGGDTVAEHSQVIEAVSRRDAGAAEAAMIAHLSVSRQRLAPAVER